MLQYGMDGLLQIKLEVRKLHFAIPLSEHQISYTSSGKDLAVSIRL
jgi:hypothetical protein